MLMCIAVCSIGAVLGLLGWYSRRERRRASSAVNQAFYGTPTPPVSSSTSSTSPPKSQTESPPPPPARDRVCMFGNDMYVIQCVDGDDLWIRRVVGNGRVKPEPRKVSCRGVTVLGGQFEVRWNNGLN